MTAPVRTSIQRRLVALGSAVVAVCLTATALAQATPPQHVPVPQKAPTPASWTGDVIVKFTSTSSAAKTRAGRDTALAAAGRRAGLASAPGVRRALGTQAQLVRGGGDPAGLITALRARSDVAYAVPDTRLAAATTDPYWGSQWNLKSTGPGLSVEQAWPRSTGAGVRVAVIDSGRTNHPDLAGRWLGGYDFISDVETGADNDGRDADPTDVGDFCDSDPSSWHGTSVAGTIAANRNNNLGIAGVAPSAQVVPIRILGRCGGVVSDLIDAMTWASGGSVPGVPSNPHPSRIINLSLSSMGVGSCSRALQETISQVRQRGALVVVAAGNDGQASSSYEPGNCPGAFTVAASTATGERASYSNYGSPVDLAAPGGDSVTPISSLGVYSGSTNNGSYGVFAVVGTSTAAPHVSGVAALLLAVNPRLSVAQLETILTSAVDSDGSCTGCGAGVLDAALAMAATPTVTSMAFAQTGLEGGTIELRGGGLNRVNSVRIGSVSAPIVSHPNDGRLLISAPQHFSPGNYPVVLSNGVVTSTAQVTLRYVDLPRVTGLSAASATPGTQLQIRGRGFLPDSTVDFGGTPATVLTISPESLWVVVPAGVANRRTIVHVTTPRGTSSASKGSIFTWR